jgi:hypothetical protein
MFAFTIDTAWFDTKTLAILGFIAALWVPALLPAGWLAKVRGWFKRDADPFPPAPDVVDDMPLLIHQMRLCVCDEEPNVRDGCNKHLDEIETLISGTEIDAV